jgi:hypothetical protein
MGIAPVLSGISKQINQIENERQGKCWIWVVGRGCIREDDFGRIFNDLILPE